ncbi:MAG: YdeI/OmpD-associated family protein, partial [Chitinophagaceae bacterium]
SYCALMFFKGSLLKDEKQVLSKAGEHSNIARQARFTNLADIQKFIPSLKLLIKEAIQVEKLGAKVEVEQKPIHIIPELLDAFKINPSLKKAFESLTPGRQRGYHIYFSQAKQSQTRKTRIEKYVSSILKGKGMQD